MPDCVRTILKDTTESQIGDIPGMIGISQSIGEFDGM